MTVTTDSPRDAAEPTVAALVTMLQAGALATVAFDFFGQALSPGLDFSRLAPVGLATQVWQALTGASWSPAGHALHYLAGLIAYPAGWLFVARPLSRLVAPGLHWAGPAILYGVALWAFALYVVAHLVAGNPPFLGFAGIAWVALAGHVLYALVTAGVSEARASR